MFRVSGNTISNKITGENLILDTDAGEIGIVDPAKLTEQNRLQVNQDLQKYMLKYRRWWIQVYM